VWQGIILVERLLVARVCVRTRRAGWDLGGRRELARHKLHHLACLDALPEFLIDGQLQLGDLLDAA